MIGQKPEVPVSYRIPMAVSFGLGAFAAIGDTLQLLFKLFDLTGIGAILGEGVGWMLSLFVVFVNSLVFVSCGVNFMSGKRTMRKMARFAGMFLVEFLPIINLIPTLTIWTWLTIRESRAQDRAHAERNATMGGARHTELRKKRLRARAARRVMESTPVTRGAMRTYDSAKQQLRDRSRRIRPSMQESSVARATRERHARPRPHVSHEGEVSGEVRRPQHLAAADNEPPITKKVA